MTMAGIVYDDSLDHLIAEAATRLAPVAEETTATAEQAEEGTTR